MPKTTTLLDRLRARLLKQDMDRSAIMRLALDTKISYDAILRLRDGKTADPGFGRVQSLAQKLGVK